MIIACEGDLGDTVMLCGVVQYAPNGPHEIVLKTSGTTKIRTQKDLERYTEAAVPLVSAQPYVKECRVMRNGEKVDWDSGRFRGHGRWCPEVTLMGAVVHNFQYVHGINLKMAGSQPWLHNVNASSETAGRVVVNRTGRYRNIYFPWQQIVNHYGDRLLFIGLPHEYRDFCGEFGAVEYKKTDNLMQAAELIAGSALFIGNQSSSNAICEGLKHFLIQEVSTLVPDCIFPRHNAQHVGDGRCELPDISESGHLSLQEGPPRKICVTSAIPPDGWEYPGIRSHKILSCQVEVVARMESIDKEDAKAKIVDYNGSKKPDFFKNTALEGELSTFRLAMQNALML